MRLVRFFVRNWPLKLASILLAVVAYGGMVVLQTTQDWPGTVSIDVVHQPADSYLIKPDPLPEVTSIRYLAAAEVTVSRNSFRAMIDLSDAKVSESADSLVNVQLIAQDPRIQIIDYEPQQIRVALDPVVHKQVSVQVVMGVVPSGLQPGSPVMSDSTVDVFGAASLVRRVAYAAAPVRVDSSGLDIDEDVSLVAHDATDQVVSNVEFDPRSVHVAILIGSQLRTETVPVSPVLSGSPAAGYYVSSIEVTPASVSVRGQADALASLHGLATTQSISIAGATADVSTTVSLSLPSGVTAVSSSQILVVVHLTSPAATRSVSAGVVPAGARSDRVYTLSTSAVTVTLGGATAALNALDTSTLVATADVTNLDVGVHTITLTVNVPAGIKVVTVTPAQVTVTVAVGQPSPTPTP